MDAVGDSVLNLIAFPSLPLNSVSVQNQNLHRMVMVP